MSNRTYGRALCAARGYALAAVGLLGSGVALAQPPNDECATATVLADGLNVGFTNVAATASAGVPAFLCGGAGPNSNDVWFTYTATCSGTLTFSACAPATASFDTVMEAYTGPCGALVSAGCNDDTCGLVSQVTIPGVVATTVFTVRLGGFGGATGTFDVNVTCAPPPPPPANDECATAAVLVDGSNPGLSSAGATTSPEAAPTCSGVITSDIWFTYTATCSGSVTFSMCGTLPTWDSVLAVYTGSCGALTQFACDDDSCPGVPAGGDVSIATTPVVAAGTTLTVRVGGFTGSPVTAAAFTMSVSCTVPTDDFGDASGSTLARHTFATVSEHLGASVTAEAATVTPSWYGDVGDDGILSVSSLFPGSTSATIVVHAENLSGTFTDFCRVWVDRNATVGWTAGTPDALPTQSASVGPAGTNFTFGPFTYSATAPPSPFVRVRLSFNTTGVSAANSTGSFGEVEDYVLPGSGGPNTTATTRDAGDAPVPYPPCTSTNTNSERLGTGVTNDATSPVGPDSGDAAWNDDTDDGLVSIKGLTPGGSCTIVVRGSDPLGTFTDTVGGWIDFDNDGNWDEVGEIFAPVSTSVGPAGTNITLGPLAVPAVSSGPYRTRLKLSFGTGGSLTSGVSFTFGEIEDYLLPAQLCSGCNTFGGPGASLFAADPPRIGGTLNVQTAGALANTGVLTVLGRFAGPGADLAAMGAPIAPGVCFLCVLPQLLFGGGTTDGSGNLTQSFPVPNDLAFQGVTVNLQNFQAVPNGLGGLDVVNTNALVLTVIL